jgi:peptidyl-prolyl cis-trans isomerase SurA
MQKYFLYFLIVMLSFSFASAQQVLDRIIAIIDKDVILESEVVQFAYLEALKRQIDPAKDPAAFQKLKSESLENLINKKVLLIQAEKDTIEADKRMVDFQLEQQMQNILQQIGGEEKVEEYFGMSITKVRKNYREQIEEEMRIRAVRSSKISDVNITRREIKEFYSSYKDSLPSMKETVEISHILVTPEPGEAAMSAAREQIEQVQEKINAGEVFEKLAKTYSEDPGSAARGGDLGFMARGGFVREFEEVAFSLEPGQVSDIVKTQFGFHIIKLVDRRGEKIHCKHILISPEPSREDDVAAAEKIKQIHKELINGAPFEEMVAKYSQDDVSREEEGFLGRFEMDQLRETAKEFVYALDGVDPGEYSDPVRTQYGFHVLKLLKRDEPRALDLEKDWQRISTVAKEQKMQKEFEKWLSEIKEKVFIEIKHDINES